MRSPERSKVLWFGDEPTASDLREAKNRMLVLDVVRTGDHPDLRSSRAAIFWARSSVLFEATVEVLERHLAEAIDNGLLVFVVVAENGQLEEVNRLVAKTLADKEIRETYVAVRTMRDGEIEPHEAPNKAALHDPGPLANTALEIKKPMELLLEGADVLFLQRAFHDCKTIVLKPISGGLSGAKTVIVDAVLRASNAGPTPMPYFAKLHKSEKLRSEMTAFRSFAEYHVPWYLRPNFLGERCMFGVNSGIIVGSFVQNSSSLWDVAREGNAPPVIRSLFEETLGLLRKEHVDGTVAKDSIASELREFCRHESITEERVAAARKFGNVNEPTSLWRKLLGVCPPWRRSALHGDMHGENVRVRKTDAIVIDFAHARTGPTSLDLASLEVSLSFKMVEDEVSDEEGWRHDVEYLYRSDALDKFSDLNFDLVNRTWLRGCVAEIRSLASESVNTADEYKRVIAICLLRWASFRREGKRVFDQERDEARRVYAYWLANRLIVTSCVTTATPSVGI